jgi:hypothetical protein
VTPHLDDDDGPCNGVCAGCDESCGLLVDWTTYRKCPVCSAETGQPCLSLSGLTPAGPVAVEAPAPHSSRKPRSTAVA